ncbi:menaquinone-dependent protoporphyrinogen IX dehydrogenase [Deefgea sp. CFH1-16]|uniref:menaquinone-dependent protoporphyrinogen IX dehydrogenase n=1 Tax=Deefgea sp. CFH1-16 TaxID=2675457 RepID=UPI0015F43433|nr:menaquinone-dependent protoporphyrinogen IX dehydrogenase [Deefgea sp. CFH1-16]MBM5574779.1 menaquinone-dependent protoporphyrinogen IX dehydrogenase [Deefgea sp. CFH1-16]
MNPTLILYASRDGQAKLIAQRVQQHLTQQAVHSELADLKSPPNMAKNWQAIIVVASIRYGRHHAEVQQFFERNTLLVPLAIISVSLNARKGDGTPNSYLKKLLAQHHLQPFTAMSVAGRLDYPRYGWFDRLMMRLIMKMTGGPSDGKCCVEYTNWQHVTEFASTVSRYIQQEQNPNTKPLSQFGA